MVIMVIPAHSVTETNAEEEGKNMGSLLGDYLGIISQY